MSLKYFGERKFICEYLELISNTKENPTKLFFCFRNFQDFESFEIFGVQDLIFSRFCDNAIKLNKNPNFFGLFIIIHRFRLLHRNYQAESTENQELFYIHFITFYVSLSSQKIPGCIDSWSKLKKKN